MFSLYSQESHEKTLQPLEVIAKMTMKPKALAQMKPTQLLETIAVKDEELLSDIALYLEKSNILAARKSMFVGLSFSLILYQTRRIL